MITVAILCYLRSRPLGRCLDSLYEHTHGPFRVEVLNQGYLDAELRSLYQHYSARPNFRVHYAESNLGCAEGRRRLTASLQTPWVFLADDDLVFTPGWDLPLRRALESRPELAAVSPYLQEARTPFFGRFEWHNRALRARCLSLKQLRAQSDAAGLVASDFLPGGCVLMRSQVFQQHQFDPNLKHDWEDIDLWLQLKNSPWKLALCLTSQVYHKRPNPWWHSWARAYDRTRYDRSRLQQSREYFCRKWELQSFEILGSGPSWWLGCKAWLRRALKRLIPWLAD